MAHTVRGTGRASTPPADIAQDGHAAGPALPAAAGKRLAPAAPRVADAVADADPPRSGQPVTRGRLPELVSQPRRDGQVVEPANRPALVCACLIWAASTRELTPLMMLNRPKTVARPSLLTS
jgi:hypothetical protein